ncbi:gluconate 5-dehydrogenase [Yersinia wautersii]|nr:gluconate 5-dehydrogenase [Yersinia wautersii]
MDVFMASLRSACSLRRGHFVNNLKKRRISLLFFFLYATDQSSQF